MNMQEKVKKAQNTVEGMRQSANNALIFRDSPEVWFQYYLGIFLEKPTIIMAQDKDLTESIRLIFARERLIRDVMIVDEFNEENTIKFAKKIALFIEAQKI